MNSLHRQKVEQDYRGITERLNLYQSRGYDITQSRRLLAEKLRFLPAGARVLDVGCGKGHMAVALARKEIVCVSVDLDRRQLVSAKNFAVYLGLEKRIQFLCQTADALAFCDHSFDAVVAVDFFHHVPNPEIVLTEIDRVAVPGAVFLLSDLNSAGKGLVADVHRAEGRVHPEVGWEIAKIRDWFRKKGYETELEEHRFETVVQIMKTVQ